MSKKDFSKGLDILLQNTQKPTAEPNKSARGSPKTTIRREITKTSQEGTKVGETRATFIVREDLLEKVKNFAYWERLQIKEVVNTALEQYFADKEDIEPRPTRRM
jgi:hypothetical protein